MPRKSKANTATKRTGGYNADVVWCNIPFTEDDDLAYEEWISSGVEHGTGIAHLIESGGNVYGKAIEGGEYRFTVIFPTDAPQNANLATSATSDDPLDALGLLLYKYFVIASEELSSYASSKSGKRRRR